MQNQPEDGRKATRFPIDLYDQLITKYPSQKKGELISTVINDFNELYKSKKTILEKSELICKHDFVSSETRPIKITMKDFNIIKLIKFETNYSYIDIIASAIEKYLNK